MIGKCVPDFGWSYGKGFRCCFFSQRLWKKIIEVMVGGDDFETV